MSREKRKRMMPRHLLTASKLIGLIPDEHLQTDTVITDEKLKKLEAMMSPKRPKRNAQSQPAAERRPPPQ